MASAAIAANDHAVSKVSDDHVRDVLTRDYSTLRFRIEYGGYLSNHLLHGVVALHELGANEQQIAAFAAYYAKRLEEEGPDHEDIVELVSPSSKTYDDHEILSNEQARELIGQRRDFDALLAYYVRDVKALGVDGAVARHLPTLVGGLAGALLHGIIQLGYSYHIGGERLVAEGLAYLHHAYLSFDEPPSTPADEPLIKLTRHEAFKVADAVTSNEFLKAEQNRLVAVSPLAELDIGWIQRGVNALSGHPERGSPEAFALIWSTVHKYDFADVDGNTILDLVLWLYVMIEHNDFVVLHAVTSAWSLQQIEHLLTPSDRARGWRVWLHVAMSALVTAGVRDFKPEDVCNQAQEKLASLPSWTEIREKALALPVTTDEHVFKLVQVADAHVHSNAPPSQLTQVERDLVARLAALKVVDIPFASYSHPPQ